MTLNPTQTHALVAGVNAGWPRSLAVKLAQFVSVTLNPGHGRRFKFRAVLDYMDKTVAFGETPSLAISAVMRKAAELGA